MKKLQIRLVLLATSSLILAAILLSWLALRHFEKDLPPEMARTVAAVSYSASDVLNRANEYGIPFEAMVGVDAFLDSVRKDNPSIAYIAISNQAGHVLYQSGYHHLPAKKELEAILAKPENTTQTKQTATYFNTNVPLVFRHQWFGNLHIGQQSGIIEQKLQEIGYDVITVLVVASLIALELMRFVLSISISTPFNIITQFLGRTRTGDFTHYLPHDRLGGIGQLNATFNAVLKNLNQRYHALEQSGTIPKPASFQFHAQGEHKTLFASSLDYIRWPFFLLVFADSLSLSFFPSFVSQFYTPSMGLSKSLVIGLPISIFMFIWALSMPWAGMWGDRVGHRKAFIVGGTITTIGLLLTAFSQSLYDLLLWRSLTALGYGLVFITAQSYVANNTPVAQRTKGMAVFLSSFFAGSLAGSAIGGILADRLGFEFTIVLSAGLSAVSALFVLRFLHQNPNQSNVAKRKLTVRDFKLMLRNPRFVAITFLAAVPAKIALTGFLYYSVPQYLKILGNNQSATGRVMMAYGMAIILLSPFIAKLADKIGKLRWFVTVGGYGAALAMFVIYFFDNTTGLLISISLLGISHAIGVSPQLALINDFCQDVVQEVGNGTATGIFRLIERIGNVLGPIIAGVLIAQFGFQGAFMGIGIICLVCITLFSAIFFWFEHRPSKQAGMSALRSSSSTS